MLIRKAVSAIAIVVLQFSNLASASQAGDYVVYEYSYKNLNLGTTWPVEERIEITDYDPTKAIWSVEKISKYSDGTAKTQSETLSNLNSKASDIATFCSDVDYTGNGKVEDLMLRTGVVKACHIEILFQAANMISRTNKWIVADFPIWAKETTTFDLPNGQVAEMIRVVKDLKVTP